MAELFINPLVPQPITISEIKITTNPASGSVLTSDASGNGTWQEGPVMPITDVYPNTISGPWASAQDFNVIVTLWAGSGNVRYSTVNFGAVSATATTSSLANMSLFIPSDFRPHTSFTAPYICFDNNTTTLGVASITDAGIVTLSSAGGNAFSGSGTTGWNAFTVTWLTDVP